MRQAAVQMRESGIKQDGQERQDKEEAMKQ
jgi:hypothetical protein